jgi:hypothetical protein
MQNLPARTRKIARSENLVGIEGVYEVVRDSATLSLRSLGSPDVEETEDLNRIAVQNFPAKPLGNGKRQVALSGPRRPDQGDQRASVRQRLVHFWRYTMMTNVLMRAARVAIRV